MRGRGDSSWAMYPAGSQTRIQEAASLTVLASVSYSLLPQPKVTVGDETTESPHVPVTSCFTRLLWELKAISGFRLPSPLLHEERCYMKPAGQWWRMP